MKKSIIISTEEIQQYIKDIRKIPVITHERQEEIFKELEKKDIKKSEKSKLFDELVVGNLRFVISVAKMYQNQGMDIMDLISEGSIGLIKAAEKFDHTTGNKFISYAVWWIRQSIMASLNENARTIRIPSNLVQEAQKARKKMKFVTKTDISQRIPKISSVKIYHIVLVYLVRLTRKVTHLLI